MARLQQFPQETSQPPSRSLAQAGRWALALLACMWLGAAESADLTASATADSASEWTASMTVYGWFAGLNGTTKLGRLPSTSVDVGFNDVAKALDFAGMGIVEVRRGKFAFVGDLIYVKLSDRQSGPLGYRTAKVGVEETIGLAAASYRVKEGEWGNLDLMGGARVFSVNTDLSLSSGERLPSRKASQNATWVDATVGAKSRLDINDRWFATVWGLVGAGGSKYSWDALVSMGYQINKTWSISAGYRAIGVDYSSPSFDYKMIQYGPVLGITARF
jgi:hypothetical protein